MIWKKKNRFKKKSYIFTLFRVLFTLVGFGILSTGVLFLYEILLVSPYFRLEKVDVVGLRYLAKEELISSLPLSMNTSLLKLDIDALKKRIKLNPWIRRVNVLRVFPRTLKIELEERIPTAMINFGNLYYMDEKGEIFKRVEPSNKLLFPVFTGIQKDNYALYDSYVKQGLKMMETVKFLGQLSEIHINMEKGITLFTENGSTQIEMGLENIPEKVHRLKKIMEDLERKGYFPFYINLNFKDMAVVRCFN